MSNYNKVILMGNLTSDPQIRQTKNGKSVGQFSLALNRKFGTGDERREETTYIDIVVWDRQAEMAEQYLNKGRSVLVEGRLQEDSWQDKKTGETRKKVRVVGERLEFVSDGQGQGQKTASGQHEREPAFQG